MRLPGDQLLDVGQELVQRRVEQADGDRQAVHGLEDLLEVGPLQFEQLGQRRRLLLGRVGEDHALHERQPIAEEHVLGAAQADALGAELTRPRRVRHRCPRWPGRRAGRVRMSSAHPRMTSNSAGGSAAASCDLAEHDLAGRAVDRDAVAFAHGRRRRR